MIENRRLPCNQGVTRGAVDSFAVSGELATVNVFVAAAARHRRPLECNQRRALTNNRLVAFQAADRTVRAQ